jgi:hypothetical protein
MRKIILDLSLVAFSVLIVMLGFEFILRIVPSLMGPPVIVSFPSNLRSEIAKRLHLPTSQDRVLIKTSERSDGGPEFFLYLPNSVYEVLQEDIDLEVGGKSYMKLDARGFCNPPDKANRAVNDMLFIGDSMTFCFSVAPEDTFSNLLEAQTGISTYNLAATAIGPYEALEVLRRSGLSLHPRVVVLGISGNDLRDVIRFQKFKVGEWHGTRDVPPGGLYRYSYALSYLRGQVLAIKSTLKSTFAPNARFQMTLNGRTWNFNLRNRDHDEPEFAKQIRDDKISPYVFQPLLVEFAHMAKEHHFIPVVLFLPSSFMAYDKLIRYEDEEIGADFRMFSTEQRRWLKQTTQQLDMDYFDLTPNFQAEVATQPIAFFPDNRHYTAIGHRITANALARELKKFGNPRLPAAASK